MKSNIKRLSFCLSALMLLILASPLTVLAAEEEVAASAKFYGTFWSLVPPLVAIALALITKEVYSSLFVGILVGALFYSNFNFEGTILHIFEGGMISVLTDSYNMGILIFLVILGTMVCLMNRAGGSAAFGRWAGKRIKSRVGAELSTIILGVLIFIDDYFNCLTVGSVMRPVTDKHNVSRAKLAYLIDATAAPVCIIAPISSWAAAVSGFVEGEDGISDLGLNPSNDGKVIRLVFPELTEERRKELVKDVKKKGEAAKVAVRNIRRDANDAFKKLAKQDVSEDEIKELEEKIQKSTDKYIKEVDAAVDAKSKEIMTV